MSRGAAAFWSVLGAIGGSIAGSALGEKFDDPDNRYGTQRDLGDVLGILGGAALGAAFGAGMGPPDCPRPQPGVSAPPMQARFP